MDYTVKKYMGLAMLCAAHRGIPIGDDVDDADARIKVEWDGESSYFRMWDPSENYELFSCKMCGEPTLEQAESILKLAFDSSSLNVPFDIIAEFKAEYNRGD